MSNGRISNYTVSAIENLQIWFASVEEKTTDFALVQEGNE